MDRKETRVFPARYESLAAIDQFVAGAAQQASFDESTVYQVQLAVDEACSNIIEHAYGGEGAGVIECTYHVKDDLITVVLRDHGQPFDPDAVPEPNLSTDLEERDEGGLGLHLMRRIMDEVEFDFESEEGNVLTMVKSRKVAC